MNAGCHFHIIGLHRNENVPDRSCFLLVVYLDFSPATDALQLAGLSWQNSERWLHLSSPSLLSQSPAALQRSVC